MEFALIAQQLWRRRVVVAVGVLLAAVAAVMTVADVSLSPVDVDRKRTEFGAAQATFYVDTTTASIATSLNDTAALTARAQVYARYINSGAVRAGAARALGVAPQTITVSGPNPDTPGREHVQPAAQQRANALLGRRSPLGVFVDTESGAPTITLFTQAGTGEDALQLARAIGDALRDHVRRAQRRQRPRLLRAADDELAIAARTERRSISAAERRRAHREALAGRTVVEPLGKPLAGTVVDEVGSTVAVLAFGAGTLVWCIAVLLLSALARAVRGR